MTDGWWVRLDTGESVKIAEHEIDIRNPDVAERLGVPSEVFGQFGRFEVGKDRIPFLRWLLDRVPIARVRGHGVWAAVEYASDDNQAAFKAVHTWGQEVCGPCLLLRFANLRTRERFNSFWLSLASCHLGENAGKPHFISHNSLIINDKMVEAGGVEPTERVELWQK